MKLFTTSAAVLLFCAACASSAPHNLGKARVNGVTVTWKAFPGPIPKSLKNYRPKATKAIFTFWAGNVPIQDVTCFPAMKDYRGCMKAAGVRILSRAETIKLAERAVKADGKCSWTGFDSRFDLTMRVAGQLAFVRDTRLLFVPLDCR